MPKRSNDFQRLVKRIYDELAPFGAKVTESAMLQDVGGGEPSEIDVLVEVPVSGADAPFRMAVECRDHARPGDKTWIESLAGKYRDLPVDRIVAVSRRGFTRGARRKAGQCRIEIRTLVEALANDWPGDLMHFSIDEVQHWPEIKEIKITADPPWPLGETAVGYRLGERSVDEREFGLWLCSEMVRLFSKEAQRQRTYGE